jgi:curved DNA-binding protein CbpA
MLKDYYSILQLPSSATIPEIKQAYRKLAMTWHPDKNPNDPYAKVRFDEIKEAYEVLTNPVKKDLYLQERWYDQSIGRKKTVVTITPVNILKLVLELERYVSTLDLHRMNKEGLFHYTDELLSTTTIEKINEFNEPDIKRQIITTTLASLKPLPLNFASTISERLKQLAVKDDLSLQRIADFNRQQKNTVMWNKYKIVVLIILTIFICLLIFLTSK